MKYLIVVLVVVVVAWLLLRGGRRVPPPQPRAKAPAAPTPASPQAMLQCDHCGVHLPRAEAVLDERGAFCSETHRLAGPRPH